MTSTKSFTSLFTELQMMAYSGLDKMVVFFTYGVRTLIMPLLMHIHPCSDRISVKQIS